MEKTAKRFLKIPELADALNCSRSKAYELTARGIVKSVLIAGLRRVPVEELDRLAAGATGSDGAESR